jgi:hypothetical protein
MLGPAEKYIYIFWIKIIEHISFLSGQRTVQSNEIILTWLLSVRVAFCSCIPEMTELLASFPSHLFTANVYIIHRNPMKITVAPQKPSVT